MGAVSPSKITLIRFEATLVWIENLDQHLVTTMFSNGLLADPTIISDGVVFNGFKKYQNTRALISSYIKMEQLRKASASNSDIISSSKKKETSFESSNGREKSKE